MSDSEERNPFDKLHEECGVFAIYGHPEAANLVYLGLHALQHRGQESAGIATSDGRKIYNVRKMGHVVDIFTPDVLNQLPGTSRQLGIPDIPRPAKPSFKTPNLFLSRAAKGT